MNSCSSSKNQSKCNSNYPDLPYESCLLWDDPSGILSPYEDQIVTIIKESINNVNSYMPADKLLVRVQISKVNAIRELGLGGFNPGSNEIVLSFDPDNVNFESSIGEWLDYIIAHEIHHAKRRRSVGYGSSLLESMISEGLADHFALEVTGVGPAPWSLALNDQQLEEWTSNAEQEWLNSSYNHDAWFFGVSNIPRWAGYSIGYELVKKYLEQNPSTSASRLHDQKAKSFI